MFIEILSMLDYIKFAWKCKNGLEPDTKHCVENLEKVLKHTNQVSAAYWWTIQHRLYLDEYVIVDVILNLQAMAAAHYVNQILQERCLSQLFLLFPTQNKEKGIKHFAKNLSV